MSGFLDTDWQAEVFLDTVLIYSPVRDADKNPIGVKLKAGPYPCDWQESPYFDMHQSPAGTTKQEDIFQANVLRMPYDVDVAPADYVSGTTAAGLTFTGFVDGELQNRQRLGYSTCKIVPIILPDIIP